jgi:hypothetical protein
MRPLGRKNKFTVPIISGTGIEVNMNDLIKEANEIVKAAANDTAGKGLAKEIFNVCFGVSGLLLLMAGVDDEDLVAVYERAYDMSEKLFTAEGFKILDKYQFQVLLMRTHKEALLEPPRPETHMREYLSTYFEQHVWQKCVVSK